MPRARTLCLAVCLCTCLSAVQPVFAQLQPQPELHPRYDAPPDQNRLVGFNAVADQLGADLVKAGRRKAIIIEFRGPDEYWSPFADWLADQFSAAIKTAGHAIEVTDRMKLADFEPIEENEFGTGTAKFRVALELGADTLVIGTYRPAENGVGVSLNAYQVSDLGNATSVALTPISTVNGKIPFTKEIGSKVYLPLDALWPRNKKFTPGEQGVGYPSCIYCPNPQYSSEAHKAKIEGIVILLAVINADGRATQIRVFKSLEPGLDEEAVEAVKAWRFKPAMDADDHPVPVFTPLELAFRLN